MHLPLSDIREIRDVVEGDLREALENIRDRQGDFTVGDWRFIHECDIDEVMQEELAADLYVLGCFNDGFLADVLDIPCEAVAAIQSAGAYEALGQMVISMGKIEELQESYRDLDGYGHHFNHHDGTEDDLTDECGYFAFRIN